MKEAFQTSGVELVVERKFALDSGNQSAYFSAGLSVIKDSKGQFILVDNRGWSEKIVLYDATGKRLKTIGMKGLGKGDYDTPQAVFDLHDTLHVFDRKAMRHTVLAPGTFEMVRCESFPFSLSVHRPIPRGNGLWLVNATKIEGAPDKPFHIFNDTGAVLKSFGAYPPDPDPTDVALYRYIALRNGKIWSVGWDRYHVELWDTAGTKIAGWIRKPNWFPDVQTASAQLRTGAPITQVVAIQPIEDDQALVLIKTPTPGASEYDNQQSDWSGNIATHAVVELIKTDGTVLARAKVPASLQGFCGEGCAYGTFFKSWRTTPEIWSVRVVKKGSGAAKKPAVGKN